VLPREVFPYAQPSRHLEVTAARSTEAQLSLKLATNLGVVHMMLFLQVYRVQELWAYGNFHIDFKGRFWSQEMCDKVRVPEGSH
jgi:hypothetical protein